MAGPAGSSAALWEVTAYETVRAPMTSEPTGDSGPPLLTRVTRAVVLLELELWSVTMAVGAVVSEKTREQLLSRNDWGSAERNRLVAIWAGVALVGLACAWFAIKRRGEPSLSRWVRLGLPLIPISWLPLLLETTHWFRNPLQYLVILGLGGLVAERCFRAALEEWTPPSFIRRLLGLPARKPWLPLVVVACGAALYAGYTGWLSVLFHHRFGSGAFDLGIFDNVMFNTLKGNLFRTTIMFSDGSNSFLLSHSNYILLLFVPIYAIYPAAETLLWIQAVGLAAGGIMLFLFARTQIRPCYAAVLSLAYFLYAPMHGGQFYDFHWLTLAPGFVFFLFYALAKNRPRLIALATLFLWLLREDLAPGLVVLGLALLLSGLRPKVGAWLAGTSAVWFALNKFVIMPAFGTWWFANLYEHLATPEEKGYGSVVKTMLSNPLVVFSSLVQEGKLVYLLHLLVPLALLPVRRLPLAVLVLPGTISTILTNAGANFSIKYQYSAHYTGYLFSAAALYFRELLAAAPSGAVEARTVLARAGRARAPAALLALVFCTVCHTSAYGVVLYPKSFVGGWFPVTFSLTPAEKRQLEAVEELRKFIPPEATLTTTTRDSSHLSNRLHTWAFSHSQRRSDYLLINPSSFGLGPTNKDILTTLKTNEYGLLKKVDDITLWKKGHESPETRSELKQLRRRLGSR